MSRTVILGLLLATLVALGLRCPELDRRPMHGDEAVHANIFRGLWEEGIYKYNPDEYHGPSLYYLTYGLAKLTGAPQFARFKESTLRMAPVVFGVGLVLLLFLVSDGLGRWPAIWAGIFTAVSPAMVFYSRYYIHEIFLVFFAFLTIAAVWRYWKGGRLAWAILAGVGFGLTYATKETFVFSVIAAAGAIVVNCWWARKMGERRIERKVPVAHGVAAVVACIVVGVVLFSSFFTNWNGVLDSVWTYSHWFKRAAGASDHIHKWNFYFERLLWFQRSRGPVWTEGLIAVLGLIGLHRALTGRGLAGAHRGFVRFLGFYTVALTAIYCVIGYKTPWCLLNFWHGMILLAGVGAVAAIRFFDNKWYRYSMTGLLLAGVAHLGFQAERANGDYCADQRNPYVYAHTSEDLLNLVETVQAISKASPAGRNLVIQIMAPESDYWPLPWYFRDFKYLGYFDEIPDPPYKPVLIISSKLGAAGTPLVSSKELINAVELAKRLSLGTDPESALLWQQLPGSDRVAITNCLAHPDQAAELGRSVAQALNFTIAGYSIYDEARFKGVALRAETEQLVREKPMGEDAARLNRMLLEDLYSAQLSKRKPSIGDLKTHVMFGLTKLRTQNFLELWVDSKLVERYVAQRKELSR